MKFGGFRRGFGQAELPWYAEPLEGGDRADLYFFGCGLDFKSCLKDFVTLSGSSHKPLIFLYRKFHFLRQKTFFQ